MPVKFKELISIQLKYTLLLWCLMPVLLFAQSFSQMVEFADEKVVEGDYFYAIRYYEKAMKIDSNSVEILWKFAEAQRKFKNYKKAAYYYDKVYDKENASIYPNSVFWLASMQKLIGEYEASLVNWKLAKKVFKKQKKSYEYRKSQQEIISCLWAQKAIIDTSDYIVDALPSPVNSNDTELAPLIVNDQLWFTSLKADSINRHEEVFSTEYSLQIYTADKKEDLFSNVQPLKGVKEKGMNAANGSVSPDGKRFYFSQCDADFRCKIMVGKISNGKIIDVDSLGEIINEPNAINTMPHCTNINGQEVLFFVSNREKSAGGLDIWYSTIKSGNQYGRPINLGRGINTMDDEISPFYDTITDRLYFSSAWHEGFGGQDIFYATQENMRFITEPVNLGLPINSSQNDTYFTIDQKASKYIFSTNRTGVKAAKSPNCCNDLFAAYLPVVPPPTKEESLADLNKRLPVTLYFHNDRPNPRSVDTTTTLTYKETYDNYVDMDGKYQTEYAKGLSGDEAEEAKEDINDFFVEYVRQGIVDLSDFIRLLKVELDKGYAIEITVKGFASPLAKTDYNVKLTQRRISSLINYLMELEDGELAPYLNGTASNGGRLSFIKIPFGEYTAHSLISDNVNDQKNSVYSRKAALERKIEIQSVRFANKASGLAEIKFDKAIHDFGPAKKGTKLSHEFKITNSSDTTLIIEEIIAECGCTNFELGQSILAPGESTKLKVDLDTDQLIGKTVKQITIKANIENGSKSVSLTTEVAN